MASARVRRRTGRTYTKRVAALDLRREEAPHSKLGVARDAPRIRRFTRCRYRGGRAGPGVATLAALARARPHRGRFAPSTAARAKALRDAGEAGAIAALIYAGVWWSAEPHEIVRHLWLSGRWHDKGVFARSSSLSGTKLEDEIKRALREEDEETMAFVRAFRAEDDRRARARAPPPR